MMWFKTSLFIGFSLSQIFLLGQSAHRYSYSKDAMGTKWNLTFYASNEEQALSARDACWGALDSLNMIFSDYDAESELSRLSASSGSDQWIQLSLPLWDVLTFSDRLSASSGGAFDVSIGPLSKIWRRAIRRKEYPSSVDLEEARSKVGYKKIKYNRENKSVMLFDAGMRLDLGGIAKGYTIRSLYRILENLDIKSALVDGGGDMMIGAAKPDGSLWQIRLKGIEKPLLLTDVSVACSGGAYQHLVYQGVYYSHIVDPRNGLGIQGVSSRCVQANDPMIADAIASTLNVEPNLPKSLLEKLEIKLLYAPITSFDLD